MFKGIYSNVAKEVGKSSAILLNQLLQWKTTKVFRTNAEMFEDLDGVLSIATIQRCKQKLIDFGYITVSFDKGVNRVTHYTLTEKALSLISKRVSKNNTRAEVSSKKDTSAFSCLKESHPVSELTTVENTTKLDDSANVERPSSSIRVEDEELITQELNKLKQLENSINHNNWIPKHLYAQKMKERRISEQQNKEFFIPKSMRESFEKAGEIRRDVVKGVPKELLSDPRLSKMLKSKQRNL